MNKIEDRELRRNGEGYLDLTAYEAIKKADAEMEGKKNSKKKPQRQYYLGPYEKARAMTLKQYIKWKLKVLNELCIELTEEEEQHLKSLKTEAEIDAYAHRLIITKE